MHIFLLYRSQQQTGGIGSEMQKITSSFLTIVFISCFAFINAENSFTSECQIAAKEPPYERHHYKKECSDFSEDIKRFSDKLNDANLKIFCEKFNDTQRQQAIQMAAQKDVNNKPKMTPDQSVERVAAGKK